MARPRTVSETAANLQQRFLIRKKNGVYVDAELKAGKVQVEGNNVKGHVMTRGERRKIAKVVRRKHGRATINPEANLAHLADRRRLEAEFEALRIMEVMRQNTILAEMKTRDAYIQETR